jgi:hypothetical protein
LPDTDELPLSWQPPPQTAAKPLRGVRRPVGVSNLLAGFFASRSIMQSCSIIPVIGTITAVGPNTLDKGGVLYRYIEISEKGGKVRRLTIVRAIEGLAALIEKDVIGLFLFWERQGERRLWCVDRADGPRQVDFEAIRAYVQQRGGHDAR